MSPLTTPPLHEKRKERVRLRMEMYRQQLRYHSEPIRHPLNGLRQLLSASSSQSRASNTTPMMLAGTVFLALFGKRLGIIGKLARVGLLAYPVVRAMQKKAENNNPHPASLQRKPIQHRL
jgi:hypothetical protein